MDLDVDEDCDHLQKTAATTESDLVEFEQDFTDVFLPGPAGRLQLALQRGKIPQNVSDINPQVLNRPADSVLAVDSDITFLSPVWATACRRELLRRDFGGVFPDTFVTVQDAKDKELQRAEKMLVILDDINATATGDAFLVMKDPTGRMQAMCSRAVFLLHSALQRHTPVTLINLAILKIRPGAAYACIVPASIAHVHSDTLGDLSNGLPWMGGHLSGIQEHRPVMSTMGDVPKWEPQPKCVEMTPLEGDKARADSLTVPMSNPLSCPIDSATVAMEPVDTRQHGAAITLGGCASETSSVGLARLLHVPEEDLVELDDAARNDSAMTSRNNGNSSAMHSPNYAHRESGHRARVPELAKEKRLLPETNTASEVTNRPWLRELIKASRGQRCVCAPNRPSLTGSPSGKEVSGTVKMHFLHDQDCHGCLKGTRFTAGGEGHTSEVCNDFHCASSALADSTAAVQGISGSTKCGTLLNSEIAAGHWKRERDANTHVSDKRFACVGTKTKKLLGRLHKGRLGDCMPEMVSAGGLVGGGHSENVSMASQRSAEPSQTAARTYGRDFAAQKHAAGWRNVSSGDALSRAQAKALVNAGLGYSQDSLLE